ncbi:MAG: hypothetical protein AUJ18_10470 [Candidatus Hydrogenedentes bacterium CG1_02_42_14]|nr:MAG: hypothetical protein AUJ18_10470 [Candidatus Hydrogenedentes bacterium CG1_02_42_14]
MLTLQFYSERFLVMPKTLKPWNLISERLILEKKPYLKVYLQDVELPNGKVVKDYIRLKLPDFVVILAMLESGEFVMEKSYKNGIGKVILETPAGMIEDGEISLNAAKRELLEETGYESNDWKSIGSYTLHANYGCGKAFFFFCEGAKKVAEPDSGDLEEMDVFLMKKEDLFSALDNGKIDLLSVATSIALVRNILEKRTN